MFRFLYFALLITTTSAHVKNVCKYSADYLLRQNSPNCWYNPDVDADMPMLVTQHHYNLETYFVPTKDGYILQIFRLPVNGTFRKGVVYLQHPSSASCTVWVDKGKDSLAYALHDDGYEVWLGNFRGSYYSRNHTTLNPDTDKVYWNFTFHEIAIYDIPETIDAIKKISEVKKITVIGHSMAGTSAAIYTALMPEHATENVNAFVMFAPAVFLEHMYSIVNKILASVLEIMYGFLNKIGFVEMGPRNHKTRQVSKLCYETFLMQSCTNALYLLFGFAPEVENYAFIPILFSHGPAGVSLKCTNHYAQTANNHGKFRYYDYGKKNNRKVYNSTQPPNYPLDNIKSTFYIFYGTRDSIVTRKDTEKFYEILKTSSGVFQSMQSVEGYNHASFLYAKNLNDLINQPILNLLKTLSF